ncbi:TetR/AcrR family transcriptional regulator [Chryseobacterium sp.]|uniref:TetR/AcrR family transcriptional regulator n=1 Tax=Chryseobacterium sp. TaxID=1871047 RepID=UPI0025C0F184|nr:TetR/AcrR family transcriptional regulator [Chryseobacterium sp.]
MKKTEKTDWLEKGLEVLINDGYQRITIDHLCSLLKITKGSFYHHFKNIEMYIDALMKYWQEINTTDFIKKTEQLADANEKQNLLNYLAYSASYGMESVIRAWSFSNLTVKHYLAKVDAMRLEYLFNLNIQLGCGVEESKHSALLRYGTLIGLQYLLPTLPKEDLETFYKHHSIDQ